jgi:anti-sigma regulatory factor (Ser/Thr protein kinase)
MLTLEATQEAPGIARVTTERQLAAWKVDNDVADVAVETVSELVTNAAVHTQVEPREVRLGLERLWWAVEIRVWDPDPKLPPLPPPADPTLVAGNAEVAESDAIADLAIIEALDEHRRGLAIVRAQTRGLHFERCLDPAGKVAVCRVPTHPLRRSCRRAAQRIKNVVCNYRR